MVAVAFRSLLRMCSGSSGAYNLTVRSSRRRFMASCYLSASGCCRFGCTSLRRGLTQVLGAMKITVALLMAIALTGCGASRAEKQQQDFFEVQAYSHLKRDMKEQEILSWAEQHKLSRVSEGSKDIILFAPGITTRWPHFPCAKTFTQIRIKLTDSNGLASYQLGRGGICL